MPKSLLGQRPRKLVQCEFSTVRYQVDPNIENGQRDHWQWVISCIALSNLTLRRWL